MSDENWYEDEEQPRAQAFVTLFDTDGIESIINITEMDEQETLDKLFDEDNDEPTKKKKGGAHSVGSLITAMTLRARMNPHRVAQVWAFTSTIDVETIRDAADHNPQWFADWVRKNGTPIFKAFQTNDTKINLS